MKNILVHGSKCIGIYGLTKILLIYNIPSTIRKNYLLFSTAMEPNIEYIINSSYYQKEWSKERLEELSNIKKRQVLPGLFAITETELCRQNRILSDDINGYSSSVGYLSSEDERPYKEFYEKLLSQERNNENITDKEDTKKEETQTGINFADIGYKENVFLNGEPVDVPIEIVNRDESIFDGSDKWYEIMEIEVDEEGYKVIQELVEEGFDKIVEFLLKKNNVTREEIIEKPAKNHLLYAMLKKDVYEKSKNNFFKDMICYDGIILNDNKKTDTKIVAQKQTRDGKNYYKIFSKHMIQKDEEFEHNFTNMINPYHQDDEEIDKRWIGINGLIEILGSQEVEYNYSSNYLLFSDETMKQIEQIRKGNIHGMTESDIKLKEVLPGVYLIRNENQDKRIVSESLHVNGGGYLGAQSISKFVKMYEDVLVRGRLIETNTAEVDTVKIPEDGDAR